MQYTIRQNKSSAFVTLWDLLELCLRQLNYQSYPEKLLGLSDMNVCEVTWISNLGDDVIDLLNHRRCKSRKIKTPTFSFPPPPPPYHPCPLSLRCHASQRYRTNGHIAHALIYVSILFCLTIVFNPVISIFFTYICPYSYLTKYHSKLYTRHVGNFHPVNLRRLKM